MNAKVVFITSQGGTHPMHRMHAQSVGADFQFVDHKIRWQDINAPWWRRYISWFVSAFTFPNKKKYHVFLSGGQHFMPVIMKKMGLLRSKQKVVCFHDNETLFFLLNNRYSRLTSFALKWLIPQYDAHICIGKMTTGLLKRFVDLEKTLVYTAFNGVQDERMDSLQNITPNLNNKNILFIGNIYSGWRSWYKGIDLMFEVFDALLQYDSTYTLTIVGNVIDSEFQKYISDLSPDIHEKIKFEGPQQNLAPYFEKSSFYLHCARGESYGITVIEAMAAGVPPIISEWTGSREIVEKVDKALISQLDKDEFIERIKWYQNLNVAKKMELSNKCKKMSKPYRASVAALKFRKEFIKMTRDLKV